LVLAFGFLSCFAALSSIVSAPDIPGRY